MEARVMIQRRALVPIALGLALGAVTPRAESSAPPPVYAPNYYSSYADSVIRFDPAYSSGCTPSEPYFTDPRAALGPPDYSGGAYGTGSVSIGSGGLLELYFSGWRISNSGDSRYDLHITEIGGYTERCFVALRPAAPTTPQDLIDLGLQDANQDGYFEIGRSLSSGEFDIDALFNRSVPELTVQFDAVQLVDDIADTPSCTTTVGSDIDAVEAAQRWVAVQPATWQSVKILYRN
jgi:hypothetical protein